MEDPIKMDYLGVPLFLETPIWKTTTLGHLERFLPQNHLPKEGVTRNHNFPFVVVQLNDPKCEPRD